MEARRARDVETGVAGAGAVVCEGAEMGAGKTEKCSRMRMCSTGPETTPFARPANTPETKSWPLPRAAPSGPPRPLRTFCAAKSRFEYSSAPNWMDTHTPMPRRGVSVPCEVRAGAQ